MAINWKTKLHTALIACLLASSSYTLSQTSGDISASELVPQTLAEGIQLREAERRARLAEVKHKEAQANFAAAELKLKTQEIQDSIEKRRTKENITLDLGPSVEELQSLSLPEVDQIDLINIDDIKVIFWLRDERPARAVLSSASLEADYSEIIGSGKLAGLVDINVNDKSIVARYNGKRRVIIRRR